MESPDHLHVMIGLPATGKTTFLAALWHVIRNHEAVNGALRLADVRGDRAYLNRIEKQWLACLPIERTNVAGQAVVIRVKHPSTGQVVKLSIPDLSGEMYEDMQWCDRECTSEYLELANSAVGALVFLHPNGTKETDSIIQVDQALCYRSDETVVDGTGGEKVQAWDPRRAPTQVKLVELLQFFLSASQTHVRIAVIVSAWDCVTEPRMTPEKWMAMRVPLLHQFLLANDDRIDTRIYGISAQGGPLEQANSLRALTVAAGRIRVVGPDGEGNDITEPVRWLMAQNRVAT